MQGLLGSQFMIWGLVLGLKFCRTLFGGWGGDDFGKEYFGVDKKLDIAGFPLNYIQRIFSNL